MNLNPFSVSALLPTQSLMALNSCLPVYTNKRRWGEELQAVQPTSFSYSYVPHSEQMSLNFFIFYHFFQHYEQMLMLHSTTLREVFVDEDSNFDLDVADSRINIKFKWATLQACKTDWQDSVEMTVFRLFNAENGCGWTWKKKKKIQLWHLKYSSHLSMTAKR